MSSFEWPPTGGGSATGTVTSVSVVSAHGFAGTVANPTSTPAITLSTTITGVLKGDGTSISAATIGNLTEATSSVLTISGGTSAVLGSGLTIQVKQSSGSVSGYLSSTDWTTFNGKQATGNYATSGTGDVTWSAPSGAGPVTTSIAATTNSTLTTLSALASVGTITTGTWNATTLALNHGGTGQTTKAAAFDALQPMTTGGDLIYGGASGTGTRLANGSAGNVLTSAGTTLAPVWAPPATSGTVTSVTFTGDGTVLSSTPSAAVTTSGTVPAALKNQNASLALMGPAFGAVAAAPTFRAIAGNDLATTVQSKSATYGVLATDDEVICSGASWTATLPAANAVPAGKVIAFIHNDSSLARQYTITRAGSDTLLGTSTSTTAIIALQGETLQLQSDGTSVWYVAARSYPILATAWTPTFVGLGTVASPSCFWNRQGKFLEGTCSFTTGTVTGTTATISIPTGLTIDTTLVGSSNVVVGTGGRDANTAASQFALLVPANTTTISISQVGGAGTNAVAAAPGTTLYGNANYATLNFKIPITGWGG